MWKFLNNFCLIIITALRSGWDWGYWHLDSPICFHDMRTRPILNTVKYSICQIYFCWIFKLKCVRQVKFVKFSLVTFWLEPFTFSVFYPLYEVNIYCGVVINRPFDGGWITFIRARLSYSEIEEGITQGVMQCAAHISTSYNLLAPLSERCSSGEVVQWSIPSIHV